MPGVIAMFGILMIMIILLAVLALIVVKALAGSPWGTFTVFATIPIAILMGLYARFFRPGRIAEMSVIGVVLLMVALDLRPDRQPDAGAAPPCSPTRGETLGADPDRLRLRRLGAAGVAAAGAARLPVDLPQDRHHRRRWPSAS